MKNLNEVSEQDILGISDLGKDGVQYIFAVTRVNASCIRAEAMTGPWLPGETFVFDLKTGVNPDQKLVIGFVGQPPSNLSSNADLMLRWMNENLG